MAPLTATIRAQMPYLSTLWRVEVRAIAALFIVALILYIGLLASYFLGPIGLMSPIWKANRDLIWVSSVGTIFTAFYGAPLYALAIWRRIASWYVAAIIGAVPGTATFYAFQNEPHLASWIVGAGVAVALLTHFGMRSNHKVERNVRKTARP